MSVLPLNRRFPLIALLLVVLLSIARPAAADEPKLAALIAQAKEEFQPVTAEEVEQARQELATAVVALERFLLPGSRKGEDWKKYLGWSEVQTVLTPEGEINWNALRTTLTKLGSGAEGLQHPRFRVLKHRLEQFLHLSSLRRSKDQAAFIAKQLDLLQKYAERYHDTPTPRTRFEIERRLELLTGIGRAEQLTAFLRSRAATPNLRAEVAEQFLDKLATDAIHQTGPLRDSILGTTIRGTQKTTGVVSVDVLPCSHRASIAVRLEGTTHSRSNGYNSPVVIRSSGTTRFTARKRMDLADDNFWNYPAEVNATTRSTTHSVRKAGGGLGSHLIEQIGWERVAEKKPQADAIAARHAEQRIARDLDARILPRLQDARYEYLHQFRQPLADRYADPAAVLFSSTSDAILLHLQQSDQWQLGAESEPPSFSDGHDVILRLHETGLANLAAAFLHGARLSQETANTSPKLDVTLPTWLEEVLDPADPQPPEAEDAQPEKKEFRSWAIRFRRLRPVTLALTDGTLLLTLHAAEIASGEETYQGWDISARYAVACQNGSLQLIRQGEIDVLPTEFDPAEEGSLTNRQVGLRGNLIKALNERAEEGHGLRATLELPPIELQGKSAAAGPLQFVDVASEAGWLSIGLQTPPEECTAGK